MLFEKISIQNFMSIRDITLPLNEQGLVLIDGINLDNSALNNNGAGKSSILEAIVYALYGRTLRGLKGDSVVNRIVQKNTSVSLSLIDDDGARYTIIRHRKHSKWRNKSLLYRDEINVSPALETEFDETIKQLIQADFTTFTSSLLYSSQSFKFAMATDSEIKKTFDTMLQLDIFSKALEIANTRSKSVQTEIGDTERFIEQAKSKISEIGDKIAIQKAARDEYDSQYDTKLTHTRQSIIALQQKETALKAELEALKSELERRSTKLEETNRQIFKMNTTVKTLKKVKDEIQNVKHAISDEQYYIKGCNEIISSNRTAITSLEAQIASKEKVILQYRDKISNLTAQIGQPCPTCGASLTEDSLLPAQQEYNAKIEELMKSIDNIKKQIDEMYTKISKTNGEIDWHNKKITDLREEMQEYYDALERFKYIEDNLSQLESDRKYLQERVYDTKAQISVKSNEISQNKLLMSQMETYLKELVNSVNPYKKIVEDLEAEQVSLNQNVEDLTNTLPILNDKLTVLKFWINAFSNQGIKSFILDDYWGSPQTRDF